MPSPLAEQLLASKLPGLTAKAGGVGDGDSGGEADEQLHATVTVLLLPVKVKLPE